MKPQNSLKSFIAPLALALSLPAIAQAQSFNPIPLTQSSYTFSIVVPANYPILPMPACVNTFVGTGTSFSDNTYFEQGLYTPLVGAPGYNCGVPFHNTVFTNINNSNMKFLMPPSYTANDDLMIVDGQFGFYTPGTFTLNTPTTASSLAILAAGGNGGCTVGWMVTYQNGGTQSGTLSVPDWFTYNSSYTAWGCNGREDSGGNINNFNSSTVNNNAPYMDAEMINGLSTASPVVSITFTYSSGGGVDNFFAVSASTDNSHYTPVAVTGFNVESIVPNSTPYPVTATMDNGTNLANPGNTWFEQGYDQASPGSGLPASGSTFSSTAEPNHSYQMGNYNTNDATLVDANHPMANLTPATPAAYSSLAFLTAGGDIGGNNIMTNYCIIQHADGVNETNLFYGYDWYSNAHSNVLAWTSNGRVYMNGRGFNTVGNGTPYIFESFFTLNDTVSPVTNIQVGYQTSPSANSTTFIMAVSGASGAIAPIITTGPAPASQTLFVGQSASISVDVSGSSPLTNTWLVEQNGVFVPLANGADSNGSIVSGANSNVLTITDLQLLDSTNYEFIASNVAGSQTSSIPVSITVESPGDAGVAPIAEWNNVANETYPVGTSMKIFSSTGPGGGLAILNLKGTEVNNGYASDGGTNGNGGDSSLMDGFLDAGNQGGTPAVVTVSNLNNSTTYNVYVYDFADVSRPQNGTDGLPNYIVNGTKYYMPVLGATKASFENLEGDAVGGTNFAGLGFIEGITQSTNDFGYNFSATNFGDYIVFSNIAPAGGAISVTAETDTSSFRSPLNGIELVPATGPSFGVHFLGNTTDPVAIAPVPPFIQFQSPTGGTVQVPTNHTATMTLSVTLDSGCTQPLSYQWYSVSSGDVTQAIAGATSSSYGVVTTNAATFYCVITNFVGSATSTPVNFNVFIPAAPSAYQSAIMALNPIAYWPLNETNGTVAFDYVGTNNGTYQGTYVLGESGLPATPGIGVNSSVYFDGNSGDVDVPSPGVNWNLNITGPMTAIEWVEVPAGGEINFGCSLGHSDQSYRFVVNGTGNQPRWADSGPDAASNFSFTSQAWHQLVGVYDGANEYLYCDGNLIDTEAEPTAPSGSSDDLNIARAPDYGNRYFQGNIAQVAIYNYALTKTQIQNVYGSLDTAPLVSITPTNPAVASGNNLTLTASLTGTPATSVQWYQVNGPLTNIITGATSSSYTIVGTPLADNGNMYEIIAANSYGTNSAYAILTVTNAAATLPAGINLGPTNAQTYAGAAVTYSVAAVGSLPIHYQWTMDGIAVSGQTNATFTMPAECGTHSVQVGFSNAYNGGASVLSQTAVIEVTNYPPLITFDTNGVGWALNETTNIATVPVFVSSNVLELTDNGAGEASSAFYSTAQYLGSFTASFIYQAGGSEAADGTAFILQNTPDGTNALGGGGGELGYYGINNSLALLINLYSPDGGVGIAVGTNGNSHATGGVPYGSTGNISVASGDPIEFALNYANGVLSVSMTDLYTFFTYSTNYSVGPLTAFLGSDMGYVGFSGGDGGATSTQTITDFQFSSVVPPVALAVTSSSGHSVVVSWPAANPDYSLLTTTNLTSGWTAGPAATVSNGTNYVTISATGSKQFYRLVLGCQ